MDDHDIVHVAIMPPNPAGPDQVRGVAGATGKEEYVARLLLVGKTPRIVAHYNTMQAAELTVRKLKDLGLTAMACRDMELRRPSNSFKVRSAQVDNEGAVFRDKRGQVKKIKSDDAFLIITGTMETREDVEVTKTRKKLNLPVTLLTGIPVRRKVTEKTTRSSVEAERFLRVYDGKSSESNIEIRQYDFDYSCLGPKIAPSSLANFATLVARIRDAFPQAIFDESLAKDFGIDVRFTTPLEKIDIICNLIYMFAHSALLGT